MLSSVAVIVWSAALSSTPSLCPHGWALVEATCEKCVEFRHGIRSATFQIEKASHLHRLYIGKRFEVEYHDKMLRWFSLRSSMVLLYPYAIDDKAYFWVRASGGKVIPVTACETQELGRVTPSCDYFMFPLRERSARENDSGIVSGYAESYTFGLEVMSIVSQQDRVKRVELLRVAAESKNSKLAAWAKWALARYYKPQFARLEPEVREGLPVLAFVNVGFRLVLGLTVPDIQGEWHVRKYMVREPGTEDWSGNAFGQREYVWQIQGTLIEATFSNKKFTKRIASESKAVIPAGGPTGVRFVDFDGASFTGSYSLKDGKLMLTLVGWAPIKGFVNTEGNKYLTITLERHKPRPPQPGFRPFGHRE